MFALIMQSATPVGAGGLAMQIMPFLLIGLIFYFLIIRPQNQRVKAHRQLLSEIMRGDTVVTNGGLIGKVKKVADEELTVTFGDTDIKVVRTMIADVRNRSVAANDASTKKK
ncbi:protein translocase subunit yajC [Litorimonas taeanensis]|uniref:Sec translocon accessory complex subunit YajC n=1 Tax=Litorimonas taeanensis TaxID=568099 RepID=A0A420WKI0_9PROT|nr:preprotein translocase subunit YajC [Litorimonas taeanensis]RKQ71533.1 protein translocase subunit yajC [Litorimonas taeanensis]